MSSTSEIGLPITPMAGTVNEFVGDAPGNQPLYVTRRVTRYI
jgi:hypothetical protein